MSALPDVSLEEFNSRANAFLHIHRNTSSLSFIANLRTSVESINAGEALLPVTINNGEPDNAWVCSPYSTYCTYAIEEAARFGRRLLTAPLSGLIRCLGNFLKSAEIDRAVAVNNWLVSTNCYPRLCDVDIDQTINETKARWPEHSIWFRSLNDVHHADWLKALEKRGCVFLPSRQVYLFEDIQQLSHRRTDLKRDLRLLSRSKALTCERINDNDDDFVRIEELYSDLYIRKYSRLNPQYRHAMIKAWSQVGLLDLYGMRDATGILQGAVGLFGFGNLITSPIVGYNTQLPRELGLYRSLAACVLREGMAGHRLVNLSAGVAHFKRQRGARPAIEYSAVVVDHLPQRTQKTIRALGFLARRIGVPVMQKFEL